MAHGLRDKLSLMRQGDAQARPKPPRHPMTRHLFEQDADARLQTLDPKALARIGHEGRWPGIEKCLFLDTETTGLSRGAGTIAFLLGLGYVRDDQLIVEQFLLGDYPDEPLMLDELRQRLPAFEVIVTYNGNAFDLPLLESRAAMCRMPSLFERHARLDLLHASRRLWKRRLLSCRLADLEGRVLGIARDHDLPGSEAPRRFFDFLKSGDRSLLDDVLLHNLLDVRALASLLIRLAEAFSAPEEQAELIDLFSMGVAMERRGEREIAERCYARATRPRTLLNVYQLREEAYVHKARMSLSMLKKRAGDHQAAQQLWLSMAEGRQFGALPLIELSKYYEHRERDDKQALLYAARALELERDPAIERRVARLERKIARREEP